jgi:hypothetical protein
MNTKTTLVLAVLAGIVAIYLFLIDKPWEEQVAEDVQEVSKSLLDTEPSDIDRIEMQVKGAGGTLTKKNGEWVLTDPVTAPASKANVNGLLNNITDLQYTREYEADDENRPEETVSGLDNPIAQYKLYSGDELQANLKIGSSLIVGQGNYLSLDDTKAVYESENEIPDFLFRGINEYRDQRLFSTKIGVVHTVEVEGLNNYRLVKSGNDWRVASEPSGRADAESVDELINAIKSVSAKEFKDNEPASYKPYGLEPARLKFTLQATKVTTKEKAEETDTELTATQPSPEETCQLLIGAPTGTDASQYFAKVGRAPWVVSVTSAAVDKLTKPLSELRQKDLVEIENDKVAKIIAQTPKGDMNLMKQSPGDWQFADGTEADSVAVKELIKSIDSLQATNFVSQDMPELQLIPLNWNQPRARITVEKEGDQESSTILVGPTDTSGKMALVRNAAEEVVAVVREDEVEPLLAGPVTYQNRQVLSFSRPRAQKLVVNQPGTGQITLEKAATAWRMTEPVNAEANQDAVNNLLQDLSSIRAKGLVQGSKADFGLDQPSVIVAVSVERSAPETKPAETQPATAPSLETYGLLINKTSEGVFACKPDGEMIYRLDEKIYEDATAEFHNLQITDFETDAVDEITFISPKDEKLTLRQEDEGQGWKCLPHTLVPIDDSKVTETIKELSDLSAQRYVSYNVEKPADYGLTENILQVRIILTEGRTIELHVSQDGPANENSRYARLTDTNKVFLLTGEQVAKLHKSLDDFEK